MTSDSEQINLDEPITVHRLYGAKLRQIERMPFQSDIQVLTCKNMKYYISYAEIYHFFINTKCYFIISKDEQKRCHIGYAEYIIPNGFPFLKGQPIIEIRSKLKYVSEQTAIVDNKLSIPFYDTKSNKQEISQFIFKDQSLIHKWIKLISQLNSQQSKFSLQIKKLKQQNNQIDHELLKMKKQLQSTGLKLKQRQQFIQLIQEQKGLLEYDYESLQRNHEKSLEHNKIIKKQCSSLKQQMQKSLQRNSQLQNCLKQERDNLLLLQKQSQIKIKAIKDEQQRKQIQYHILIQDNLQKISCLQQRYHQKVKQLAQTIEEFQKKLQFANRNIKEKEESSKRLQLQTRNIQQQFERKQNLLKIALQNIVQLKKYQKQQLMFSLFSNVLQDFPSQKEFLKQQIQSITNKKINKTRQIYNSNILNKINFHKYIDNQPNIVLIIKTVKGMLISAFSEQAFQTQGILLGKKAFIASLTNKKSFQLIQGKKPITYDDYYIIFGNSQLQIRCSQLKVFSNFGITNGFYKNKEYGVSTLLGQNLNQVQIQTYEFYSIQLAE